MLELPRRAACFLLGILLLAAASNYASVSLAVAGALSIALGAWLWWRARERRAVPRARPEEKLLYEKLWAMPGYRKYAPGEHVAQVFLQVAKPQPGAEVLDLGCGTGRGSLNLAVVGGLKVTMLDFARNCLDEEVASALETGKQALRFVEADLTKKLPVSAQYGFCTDVMEHIPEDKVKDVLDNCLGAAKSVFFQICTVDDAFGQSVGFPLHLTVRPYEWWLAQFRSRNCVVHWSENQGVNALFYVSA